LICIVFDDCKNAKLQLIPSEKMKRILMILLTFNSSNLTLCSDNFFYSDSDDFISHSRIHYKNALGLARLSIIIFHGNATCPYGLQRSRNKQLALSSMWSAFLFGDGLCQHHDHSIKKRDAVFL